jgi:hypothetical protein
VAAANVNETKSKLSVACDIFLRAHADGSCEGKAKKLDYYNVWVRYGGVDEK